VHNSGRYRAIHTDYGHRLRNMQYRYRDETGRWRGGMVVSDSAGKRSGSLLFRSDDSSVNQAVVKRSR